MTEESANKEISRLSLSVEALAIVVKWQSHRMEMSHQQIQEETRNRLDIENRLKEKELSHEKFVTQCGHEIDVMQKKQEAALKAQQEASKCRELTTRLEVERRENEFATAIAKVKMETKKMEESYILEMEKLKKTVETNARDLETAVEEKEFLQNKVEQLEAKISTLSVTLNHERNKSYREEDSIYYEAHSLDNILELKNRELKEALDEVSVMKEKQADYGILEESTKNLRTRTEDLKAQLAMKTSSERSLEAEVMSLQRSVQKEANVKRRLSRENEQLEWKVKDNSPCIRDVSFLNRKQQENVLACYEDRSVVLSTSVWYC